jgi:hypothetical protein
VCKTVLDSLQAQLMLVRSDTRAHVREERTRASERRGGRGTLSDVPSGTCLSLHCTAVSAYTAPTSPLFFGGKKSRLNWIPSKADARQRQSRQILDRYAADRQAVASAATAGAAVDGDGGTTGSLTSATEACGTSSTASSGQCASWRIPSSSSPSR